MIIFEVGVGALLRSFLRLNCWKDVVNLRLNVFFRHLFLSNLNCKKRVVRLESQANWRQWYQKAP